LASIGQSKEYKTALLIAEENPFQVQYFETSVKEKSHRFNEEKWPILREDLGKKVSAPRVQKGRTRNFYYFE